MFDWLIIAALLAALVFFMAPQQLPVSLYKLSLVALAAVAGYWIDRSLFPYARPDAFMHLDTFEQIGQPGGNTIVLEVKPDDVMMRLMGIAMLRRAIIVASTMLAVGLGA
jgi:hypothetical protein